MIKPLKKNIIIKTVKEENTTSFGLILEDKTNTPKAEVLAIGNLVENVQVGDTIVPDWRKVKASGEFMVVLEDDIMLIL
jgi:co-chaperonin GroES (HSP10)